MATVQGGIAAIFVAVVAIVMLNAEIGTETEIQTYFTEESLAYEETFVREGVTTKWQLWLPPRVTVPEIQFGIKNLDTIAGEFLVTFTFDNGSERRNENESAVLAPGQEVTLVIDSPIEGPLTFETDVTPPTKTVEHQEEVEVPYTVFDKLWQLRDLRFLRPGR